MFNNMSVRKRYAIGVCFWIVVWQVLALVVGEDLLLVGPIETLVALAEKVVDGSFWMSILCSFARIGFGFVLGLVLGVLLAILSAGSKVLETFLLPLVKFMVTIPVASFVVLFLIWWGSKNLSVAISFCVVFPFVYVNTLEGIHNTDKKLLEMAKVFCMPIWNRIFYIYRPAVKPFLDGAIKVAVGMCWKAGVAAEVIGISDVSIGGQLYMSKIYMDTAGVLAWTLMIILLSAFFERIVLFVWKRILDWQPGCKRVKVVRSKGEGSKDEGGRDEGSQNATNELSDETDSSRESDSSREPNSSREDVALRLTDLSKSYDGQVVLESVSGAYKTGEEYLFQTPSGSGKTTLFRIIAGLEKQDQGMVERNFSGLSMVFQEDRLCEEYSAIKNVEMVTGSESAAREGLLLLLEEEDLYKPCKELSGGMKRRVAIVRALLAEGEILILDEPFTGLDEENQKKVRELLEAEKNRRAILLASHI